MLPDRCVKWNFSPWEKQKDGSGLTPNTLEEDVSSFIFSHAGLCCFPAFNAFMWKQNSEYQRDTSKLHSHPEAGRKCRGEWRGEVGKTSLLKGICDPKRCFTVLTSHWWHENSFTCKWTFINHKNFPSSHVFFLYCKCWLSKVWWCFYFAALKGVLVSLPTWINEDMIPAQGKDAQPGQAVA